MANIVYFEIPADNDDRAKHLYHSLLGWKIESTKVPVSDASMQYQDIITGDSNLVTLTAVLLVWVGCISGR
jgi:predicted enzyme related to lactoylglutathione lyase